MARLGTFRRDTAANWELVNPIIADGEFILVATDPLQPKFYNEYKVGNGTSVYTALVFRGLPAVNSMTNSVSDVPSTRLLQTEFAKAESYNVTTRVPLSAGQYYNLALAIAAVPTANRKVGLKLTYLAALYEKDTLTVTTIPTVAGNITITLNGVAFTIAIDPTTDTTTTLVADKIRTTSYTGWTISGTEATVVFTKNAIGVCTAPVFDAGTTGSTASFTRTVIGSAENLTEMQFTGNSTATWTTQSNWRRVANNDDLIQLGADLSVKLTELESEIGYWDVDKKDMLGSYTITKLIENFSLNKGDSLLISITDYSGGNSWLQIKDNDGASIIITYLLPSSGFEKEYIADVDYTNLSLTINVESNNTSIKAKVRRVSKVISVIDSLESSSKDSALSAAKGKELSEYIPIASDFGTGKAFISIYSETSSFKVTITQDANIKWIRNKVHSTKFIAANTEYIISPNYALCIDTRDFSILTISREQLKSYHLPLIIAPEYDENWYNDIQGYFIGKKQVLDDSQQGRERNRINAQRNLGNVIVSYYGTGFINDWAYNNGQVQMVIAERAVIYYFLDNDTFNSIAIDAGESYLIPSNNALVIDSIDNQIKTKGISKVTLGDLVLAQTGEIDSNYKRYMRGFFSDRILIATSYENYDTHNVKQIYVRDVDNDSIYALQNKYDFSMLISTDLHINTQGNVFNSPTLNVVERIRKNITPNAVVNLGDSVALGLEDPLRAYFSMNDLKQPMGGIDNLFLIVGNHDYNNISELSVNIQPKESIIPKKAIYNLMGKFHEDDCVWGSKEGMYYYKDFEDAKIRMICLNTLDKPEEWLTIEGKEYEKYPWLPNIVSKEQINWFADVALNFSDKTDKAEWAVIICSHVTPAPNVPGNSASIGALQNENPQGIEICKIAEAFVMGGNQTLSYTDNQYGGNATLNRVVDFSAQGAMKLIGWFAGHNHHDYKVTINGVTYITTLCGYYSSGADESYISMQKDTYSEVAVDLLMIDKASRKAVIKRYGAGEDRELTW